MGTLEHIHFGVITVSDRASRGEYEDESGPAIQRWLDQAVVNEHSFVTRLVPDEQSEIEQVLRELTDEHRCPLILTTGGTGPAPRDVTPEATLAVADKVLDGFGEKMRSISLKYVPTAILSRQVGVIRGSSLIVNLPGKPKSIHEILDDLFVVIPFCIELMEGPTIETDPELVQAFRPKPKSN